MTISTFDRRAKWPITPAKDYLAKQLHVSADSKDIGSDISNRLKEVHAKLEARFDSRCQGALGPEEALMARAWDKFKKQIDIPTLPTFEVTIKFKDKTDQSLFQKLVSHSDSLQPLDSQKRLLLSEIVGFKDLDRIFPVEPGWLSVAKLMAVSSNFSNNNIAFYFTSAEMKAFCADLQKAQDRGNKKGAEKPTQKPLSQTTDIPKLGLTWIYYGKGDPGYGLSKGWEPRLKDGKTSVFRMRMKSLENAFAREKAKAKPSRNLETLHLLRTLIDTYRFPQRRADHLGELRKKYPPPPKKE